MEGKSSTQRGALLSSAHIYNMEGKSSQRGAFLGLLANCPRRMSGLDDSEFKIFKHQIIAIFPLRF